MIELLAAALLAPWTHPLAFRPLPGWRTGASGNVPSLYGPSSVRAPREATAWIARNVRYRDGATEDPPNKTLRHLPSNGVIVWAVILQGQTRELKPYTVYVRIYFGSRATVSSRTEAQRALSRLELRPLR
jgi:hypothetical protein